MRRSLTRGCRWRGARLPDDLVAYLAQEHHQPRRRVVEVGVLPHLHGGIGKRGGISDLCGGSLEPQRQWPGSRWPRVSLWECRAARGRQARAEEAQGVAFFEEWLPYPSQCGRNRGGYRPPGPPRFSFLFACGEPSLCKWRNQKNPELYFRSPIYDFQLRLKNALLLPPSPIYD